MRSRVKEAKTVFLSLFGCCFFFFLIPHLSKEQPSEAV